MDSITRDHRSWNMSRIRSKNTTPELLVRKALTNLGFRYRLHVRNLPGKPDIVLKKYRTVVFINGCFWHQHEGCKRRSIPKSNLEYWTVKLKRNIERQRNDIALLKDLEWKSLIIWECQVKQKDLLIDIINNNLLYEQ